METPAPPTPLFALVRRRIEDMLVDGFGLGEIERELIGASGLDQEEQAALWLYAWCRLARSGA